MASDPTTYPNNTVVYITDTIGGVEYQGSGVLISPDEVLTASHVVYIAGVGTASNISVTPGAGVDSAPYGTATATHIYYNAVDDANRTISNEASQSDFAVLHLSSSFLDNGTMGLLANYGGGAATISGYPQSAGGALVVSDQTVTLNPNYTLLDDTTLGDGSSGGPVYVGGSSDPQVVGIVSSANGATGYDTLITNSVFDQIEQWVAADDAGRTWVYGTHSQYVVANNDGSLYCQDLVANRDGTQTEPGIDQLVFTDGTGYFDASGNAEEVARLYSAAFARGPDLAGLDAWTRQVDSGALTLDDVSMAFIQGTEFQTRFGGLSNQGFVEQIYQNALGRAGDAAGVAAWTADLNQGVSRGAVMLGISDSFEHKEDMLGTTGDKDLSEIYRMYEAAFGAAPDTGGLAYWTGVLDSGASVTGVATALVSSPAFASLFAGDGAVAMVNQFYENTFHQAADSAGQSYWVGQLNSGASAAQVMLGFADSLQNRVATAGTTHDAWVFVAS